MSDEERIKKLIENHDENLLRLEERSKEKRKHAKSLHPLSCYILPDDEYCKYNTDDVEFLNYLKRYTVTMERAQKELNLVRIQSDKWGHDYKAIRGVYVNDFFPAISNAKIKKEVAHNLFISLLEYATANSLTDEGTANVIKQTSEIINSKTIPTSNDLGGVDEQFNDIKEYINYTTAKTNYKNLNNFYGNLANYLHYELQDKALEQLDPVVLKSKKLQNMTYDLTAYPKWFIALMDLLPINISSLLLDWMDSLSINIHKKAREKFTYSYNKYQGEEEFFTPEEQNRIYGVIKKYNPGPYLFWRKAPSNPYEIPPTDSTNNFLNYENNVPLQNTELNTFDSQQETVLSGNTDVKNASIDISAEVKRVLADTIDDFVQLKGFRKNKIT